MHEEFERTFLAKKLPEGFSRDTPAKEIMDIYLPRQADHPVLRIRKQGELYEITKKQPVSGSDSSHQIENTIPLTALEFQDMAMVPGKRVRKIRYYYTEGDTRYELDVFQDDLQGLVLVDVEFATGSEKDTFTPPDWVLAEVTQDAFVAGGMLCGKSYADIAPELAARGYTPIFTVV